MESNKIKKLSRTENEKSITVLGSDTPDFLSNAFQNENGVNSSETINTSEKNNSQQLLLVSII